MILILKTHVTCIISTTWCSWTYHVILFCSCPCDLVIILHNSYWFRTFHVHYIYVTPCMRDLLVYDLSSRFSCYYFYFHFSIFPIILFLLFQCPTCIVIASSYSLFYCSFPFVYSCWSLLMDLYYFSVFRSESRYRELIVDHILVQLFSSEFNFFSWLVLFRYDGWHCLYFSISYMWFWPCSWLYMHICVLSCSLLTA